MIPAAWRAGEVAVVGLGRSGVAAAEFLAAHGVAVYASDVARCPQGANLARALEDIGVRVELGRHDLARIRRARAVVVSPGVPPEAPPLAAARDAGVEVVSELDLGARALAASRLIVVTGTNGKTTTTALTAHLLSAAGCEAAAAGNIGRPLVELARDPSPPPWVVVEASSFQLHDAPHLRPAVGILTNLGADHLDRYASVEDYHRDKRQLFRNASEESTWVLNGDDEAARALAHGATGRRVEWSLERDASAWFDRRHGWLIVHGERVLPRSSLALLGDHNVANTLAAALAAVATGLEPSALVPGLETFLPLPHRLEPIATADELRWINDSKATNIASVRVALRAVEETCVLILGGRAKGERFAALLPDLGTRCRAVVAYGEAAEPIAQDLAGALPVKIVPGFDAAVQTARQLGHAGDAVLLSPGCSSFDQFTGFEERGDTFRRLAARA